MTLTDRELDVIDTLTANPDWTTAQLAQALGMTFGVAKNHLEAIYRKYDVGTRTAAVKKHSDLVAARSRRRRSSVAEGQLEAELTA